MDGRRVVGILDHITLFQALRERGDLVPVGDVMRSEFVTLRPDQSLDDAFTEASVAGSLTMAVTENGRFVGLLTPENVGEFFMIRRAQANRPPPPPGVPPVFSTPPVIAALRPSRGTAT